MAPTAARPVAVDVDDLVDRLRATGARVTPARRLVLAELARAEGQHTPDEGHAHEHPSAEQLAGRIRRDHPDVHLSTVYRTLERLEELGLVIEAGHDQGATTYHLAHAHHHHAVCEQCGTVIDLPATVLAPLSRHLAREFDFAANLRHLTITGRCAACRADR
jgi:Fur family ferric uptake transcriptional regulator